MATIGKLEQRFDDLIIPKQPCKILTDHLAGHSEKKKLWDRGLVGFVFGLLKMGIVLAAGYLFGKKN